MSQTTDLNRLGSASRSSKRITRSSFTLHSFATLISHVRYTDTEAPPVVVQRVHTYILLYQKKTYMISDGTSFTDSSMDELSEDSSIHCMQSEV